MKTFRLIEVGLIAAILCFAFASCSDDDDDSATNSIIGTWMSEYYDGSIKCTSIITFKTDGTAVETLYEGNYEPSTNAFNYVYYPSHKMIIVTYYDEGVIRNNTIYVEFISNNKIRVYEDGQSTIFIRTQ